MRLTAAAALFVLLGSWSTAFGADWPQWRGPDRTGISPEKGLLSAWPAEGPPLAWTAQRLGAGFSTPSVVGDRLYVMGDRDGQEWILALDVARRGRPVWERAIGSIRNQGAGYPGPRSTPTVDGDRIYALGINGDLLALDAQSGEIVWRRDLTADLGGAIPNWGYSESVLIDGDRLLCTPGGSQATLAALDKRNGAVIWKAPHGDGAGYASIVKAQLAGRPQYIQFTARGVIAVAAESGALLWRYDGPANGTANIATPIVHDKFVFAASGYGAGGGLVAIDRKEGRLTADQVYFTRNMKNHHGGVLLVDGYLYGCNDPGLLTCLDFGAGDVKWADRSAGKCSLTYADGRLYARSESGTVSLVEATPDGFRLRGQFEQPQRSDEPSWPHPVVAGGMLYLRDQDLLLAYDVRQRGGR